jgi:glycosyltransferase involved in cell wall biosynthesis
LAGQGDASEELSQRTHALGIQNQVQLLGHYTGDVCALLDTFDIYIFPSLWEGFPYSIVESLRSGCTIVASSVGGIPEAVTDGIEGILIKPGSTDAIIDAIKRLISDPDMCHVFSRNARLKYERDLALQKMHSRVRDILV